jgi:hypothetical protein
MDQGRAVVVARDVGIMGSGASLADDLRGDSRGQLLGSLDDFPQRLTVGELHDAGIALVQLREAHHRDDVGVVELGRVLCFALDLREQRRVLQCSVGHPNDHHWARAVVLGDRQAEEGARPFPGQQRTQGLVAVRRHGATLGPWPHRSTISEPLQKGSVR